MDRRAFIQRGCLVCTVALVAPTMLTSCGTTRTVVGTVEGDDLVLPEGAFTGKDGAPLPYVIATHAQMKQPVVVFKREQGYEALLMRCTHRGVELRMAGERLECPAHGSLFDGTGAVLEGPASAPLRKLSAREREGRVHISLKA